MPSSSRLIWSTSASLAETKDTDFATKMDALTNATTGFLVNMRQPMTAGSISAAYAYRTFDDGRRHLAALVFSNFSTSGGGHQ